MKRMGDWFFFIKIHNFDNLVFQSSMNYKIGYNKCFIVRLLCLLSFMIVTLFSTYSYGFTLSTEIQCNKKQQPLSKPRIHIIATGGTIAGSGTSKVGSSYKAGEVSFKSLVDAVPEISAIASVTGEQLLNIGSQDMNEKIWLKMASRLYRLQQDTTIDGIVITHGTDTMDETAFFLSLTVHCNKPVILVGAMRPSSHISADGPENLYNAIVAASDKRVAEYGVSVVMNDLIFSAMDVEKTNTMAVDAFKSYYGAPFGFFLNGKLNITHRGPLNYNLLGSFDISDVTFLPKVGIVYGYAGVDKAAVEGFVKAGYRGIVYAGVGNGNLNKEMIEYLSSLVSKGFIVVRSSRVPAGGTMPDGEIDDTMYGFYPGGRLSPQKCRVLLLLCIAANKSYMTL